MIEKSRIHVDYVNQIIWSRVYSYILFIALERNLFKEVAKIDSGITLHQVSILMKMPLSSSRVLVQYLCSLELLIKKGDKFINSEVSTSLLTDEAYNKSLLNMSTNDLSFFKQKLYQPNDQPWYSIKNNNNVIDNVEGINQDFFTSDRQHKWRIEKGVELASKYRFDNHTHLLDIGGASGGWSVGIRQINNHLRCTIFDLPEVCRFSKKVLADYHSLEMLDWISGDIFKNPPYPRSVDVILLANVLHDWSKKDVIQILKNIFEFFPKITVLISELFLNDNWIGPLANLTQAIYVLGPDNKSGWQPSYMEMEFIVREVGFKTIERTENLIVCTKGL